MQSEGGRKGRGEFLDSKGDKTKVPVEPFII